MKSAMDDKLVGTNAIVFAYGDPSASAKALSKFGEEVEAFQLKSGVMDGAGARQARDQVSGHIAAQSRIACHVARHSARRQ